MLLWVVWERKEGKRREGEKGGGQRAVKNIRLGNLGSMSYDLIFVRGKSLPEAELVK